MHMVIVPFSNTEPSIPKMIPIMALMEKATSRKIVIRFSVSQSISLVTQVIIAPHPLNRALGLGEEGYLDVSSQQAIHRMCLRGEPYNRWIALIWRLKIIQILDGYDRIQDHSPSILSKQNKLPFGLVCTVVREQRKRHWLTTRLLIRLIERLILLTLTFLGWLGLYQLLEDDTSEQYWAKYKKLVHTQQKCDQCSNSRVAIL